MLWGYIGIPTLFFAAFFIAYKINRVGLIPSVFFTCFLFSSAFMVALFLYHSDSTFAKIILVLLLCAFLFVVAFGAYALLAFLLLNARAVLKREKRSLANCLTLILAIAVIVYMVFTNVVNIGNLHVSVRVIMLWIELLIVFYVAHVTQFMTASVLCNLSRPKKNQDYIIVHGAGLMDGAVSPLLGGRVDRAIRFYNEQKKVGTPPKLILSGGQGADELRSEAEAMSDYALEKGIPKEDILLEMKSVNTLENMLFSKKMMDDIPLDRPYRAIYATSNYHLLRTGIYARQAGLKISGIGSKTAFYYLPVAFLREYAAYIVLRRRRNIIYALSVLAFSCALSAFITYFS